MQFTIIRATSADAEALAGFGAKTFSDTFSGTCTDEDMQEFLDENFNLQQVKNELANEQDLYYLAISDGKPIGYLRMMEDYSNLPLMKQWKALELKRLYVDKAFHGMGIAQDLMKFVEQFARQNQFEVIWLGVWEHNVRAKMFYKKCGFTDSGQTHDFPIGSTLQTDNWFWKFLEK